MNRVKKKTYAYKESVSKVSSKLLKNTERHPFKRIIKLTLFYFYQYLDIFCIKKIGPNSLMPKFKVAFAIVSCSRRQIVVQGGVH